MLLQRVRDAENRMKHRLSNGPPRVQSNAQDRQHDERLYRRTLTASTEYSATWGHTLVAGDMLVSCKECSSATGCKSRWHRG